MKLNLVLLIFLLFPIYVLGQADCTSIPNKFNSYLKAEKLISTSKFNYYDNANTSRSSWIQGAKYYSCDKKVGYLILYTSRGNYLHSNVPISIWYNFKSAQSLGSYYSRVIRNRYQIIIKS